MSLLKSKINIFVFDNYRNYLKAVYDDLKKESHFFSYRYFSQKAGLKSPNFLQLVIQGKRNLTSDSIQKCSQVFHHSKEEAAFFRNLVLHNQANTIDEKSYFTEQLVKSSAYKKANPLSAKQYVYYSNWYLIPIREMVGSKSFKEDAEWISKHLEPKISAQEASKALELLIDLELITRDSSGKLVQTNELVSTGDDVKNSFVLEWHRHMIQKGEEAISRFKSKEREISSVTIGLSQENATQVKQLIRDFRKKIMAIAAQDQNIEKVYQANFQLFPLSKELDL